MAHAFRDRAGASLVRLFQRFGAAATYTPAGGDAVPGLLGVPSFGDAVVLEDVFAPTIQAGLQVALLKSQVAVAPSKGARIVLAGWGEYEVAEAAASFDRFRMTWACRVVEIAAAQDLALHGARQRAAESLARGFINFGAAAVYTSSGGQAVGGFVALPSFADQVVLQEVFAPTVTQGSQVALLRTQFPDPPAPGDIIELDGWGTYEVAEEAASFDPWRLVWACRVVEIRPARFASAFIPLAAPLCTASASLGAAPIHAAAIIQLYGVSVSAEAAGQLAGAAAVTLAPAVVSAMAVISNPGEAFADVALDGPSVSVEASAPLAASAAIALADAAALGAALITVAVENPAALAGVTASAETVAPSSAALSITLTPLAAEGVASINLAAAASLALGGASVSATAQQSNGPTIEAAITLAEVVGEGEALAAVSAVAAITFAGVSFVSDALVGVAPYVGVDLDALTVAATAVAPASASAEIALDAAVAEAACVVTVPAVNACMLVGVTAEAGVSATLSATTSFTLPGATASATATAALVPAATPTLAGVLASGTALATVAAAASLTLGPLSVSTEAEVEEGASGIVYIGGKTGTFAGATSGNQTPALNSGLTGGIGGALQEGDLVIVAYGTGSTADRTLSITDGANAYTLAGSELRANDDFDANLRVAYKFMGSSPDTSVTIGPTGNAADAGAFSIRVYRGVDPAAPLDVAVVTGTGTNTGRADGGSITPVSAGAKVVVFGAGASATGADFTSSDLSNFHTAWSSDTNDVSIGSGDFDWTSGPFNPAAFGAGPNTTADSWAAVTIALRKYVPWLGAVVASAEWGESDGASTVDITKPSGTVDGSLLIARYGHFNGTALPTLPSGWSWGPTQTGTIFGTQALAYKRCGASEPSAYTWPAGAQGGGDSYIGVSIMRVTGAVASGSPFEASSNFNSNTSGTARTNTGITTSVANVLLLLLTDGFAPYGTPPDGFSVIANTGDDHVSVLQGKQATAGATGSFSLLMSPSAQWIAFMVGIKPA